jgi:hypothetical protein
MSHICCPLHEGLHTSMMLRDDQRITIREEVLSRQLDGEAVLLDLQSGTYFGLNEIGAFVWDLVSAGKTVGEIRNGVLDAYEVEPEVVDADLERLIDDLRRRGLVDLST